MDYSMSYEEISNTISRITVKTGRIDALLNQITMVVTNLESVWKGTDAVEYVNKINEYKPQIEKLKQHYLLAMKVLEAEKKQYEEVQLQIQRAASNLTVN